MTIKQKKEIAREQSFSGFTLVEILVVVAIIGLLATIVMISLSGVGEKGNNARRIEDLRSIHTALVSYYYKATPYYFPTDAGASPYSLNSSSVTASTYVKNLATSYIQKIPDDPDPVGLGYVYKAYKTGTTTCTDTSPNYCKNFVLCADLEPANSTAQQVFCCNKDGCNKGNAAASKCATLTACP